MKPLPNFDDEAAMASRGRRSALMSCRGEACEKLRDAVVSIQSCDVFHDDISEICESARDAICRLEDLSAIAKALEWK